MKVGTVSVQRIAEFERTESPPAFMFAELPAEAFSVHRAWLEPSHYDAAAGNMLGSIHSWLVRTDRCNILIDPCVGNGKSRPAIPMLDNLNTPYLETLATAGVTPEDIDFVLCTHLHIDHCGWNTRLRNGKWVPTFPRAKYLFSKAEYDYWAHDARGDTSFAATANAGLFEDSVLPVVEAGQALILDAGEHSVAACLSLSPAIGHSPGHMMAKLDGGSKRGIFCGDIMHHPLQIYYPLCNSAACMLPDQARTTRLRLLDICADESLLLMPAHFAAPHAFHVGRRPEGGFQILFG